MMLLSQRINRHNLTHTHRECLAYAHHRAAIGVDQVVTLCQLGRALRRNATSRNAKTSHRSIGRALQVGQLSLSGQPLAGLKSSQNGASSGAIAHARHDFCAALAANHRIKSPTRVFSGGAS